MSLRRLLVTALAAAFSMAVSQAFAGDDVPKPAVKRGTVIKEVEQSKKDAAAAKTTPKWWRRTTDHPCDSTACRPFRFAWSPVAPGA